MYINGLDIAVYRLLSFINLDPNSSLLGSFDRYYWAWKKRDFQDSTLGFAYLPLMKSTKYNNFYVSHDDIEKIVVHNICSIQRPDGSFDQSYPFEKHPKVGLDLASVLYNYLIKNDDRIVRNSYKQLIEYSLKSEERYGVICNHIAHYAYEYLLAYHYFKDKRYYEKTVQYLHTIEKNSSKSGFHLEYQGGDPGYQTRTLKYLAKSLLLLEESDRKLCEKLCVKSCSFLDKTVMPDGTLYAMFGSRNTALIYPSGIEYMAYKYPHRFSDLARRVRNSINSGLTPLPLHLEFDNFIRLLDDYLDAQEWFELNRELKSQEIRNEEFDLKDFGFKKFVREDISIYFHYKYGGACAVYQGDKPIAKDAGILIKDSSFNFWGTRNLLNYSETLSKKDNEIDIKTVLFKSSHQELTPLKMIALRILNFSVLRIKFFADFFRKLIVRKLIVGRGFSSRGTVKRSIKVENDRLLLIDRLNLSFKPAKLFRVVYLHLFHMASSRYWNPSDKNLVLYQEISDKFDGDRFDLIRELIF